MNLYLSTIRRLLVMSVISSGTPNKLRSSNHITHNTNRHLTLSVQTLRVRELCRHDRDMLPVNNQQRNLDAHIGSYIFYEDLYRSNHYDNIRNSLCLSVCYLPEIQSSVSSCLVQSRYWQVSLLSVIHHPATNSLVAMLARLILMCITEWAQRYLSDNRSDKS